jgi:hypothetical protein
MLETKELKETKPQDNLETKPVEEQPIYYVLRKEALLSIIGFLKKLPWETSNEILHYIDKNATEVKLTELKNQENEKDTETSEE